MLINVWRVVLSECSVARYSEVPLAAAFGARSVSTIRLVQCAQRRHECKTSLCVGFVWFDTARSVVQISADADDARIGETPWTWSARLHGSDGTAELASCTPVQLHDEVRVLVPGRLDDHEARAVGLRSVGRTEEK